MGLTPLPASRRGGLHAWAPTSSPCLPPAPTTTAMPGRVHPPLPATPAPPPTLAAPSVAPAAPPVAPPPSSSEARVQIQRMQDQTDGSASLPDSLPANWPTSIAKAPTASPGPPSSSTGQSVAEQEVNGSGAADSGVAPAAPAPLVALLVGPSPSLRHANYSAPPQRPAQPESASARPAKSTFTSPYHVYCQEQRPLLVPLVMRNRDREKLLGVLAP